MKTLSQLKKFLGLTPPDPREKTQRKERRLKGRQKHSFGGVGERNLNAIYFPSRSKFRGYMRESRRTDRGHGYNKHHIIASR